MSISLKADAGGTSGSIQLNGTDVITIGANGITSGIGLTPRNNNSTETLTSATASHKLNIVVTSVANVVKTLPLLSSMTNGAIIGFHVNGVTAPYVVTIQQQGADQLSWHTSAGLNSVSLASYGDYLYLVADTTANRWRVLSENIQGPAFEATLSGSNSIGTATFTKVQFNSEVTDSHGCFDPTTNFRFTPTIPGWYHVSASVYISCASGNRSSISIYKNGSAHVNGQRSYTTNDGVYTVSKPVFLNGSTDYVEIYAISNDSAGTVNTSLTSSFSAVRIR